MLGQKSEIDTHAPIKKPVKKNEKEKNPKKNNKIWIDMKRYKFMILWAINNYNHIMILSLQNCVGPNRVKPLAESQVNLQDAYLRSVAVDGQYKIGKLAQVAWLLQSLTNHRRRFSVSGHSGHRRWRRLWACFLFAYRGGGSFSTFFFTQRRTRL